MSHSYRKDGLPVWLTSELVIGPLLILFLVGGLLGFGPSSVAGLFSSDDGVSSCFGSQRWPVQSMELDFETRDRRKWGDNRQTMTVLQQLDEAARYCRLDDCPPAARDSYARAARDYVKNRAKAYKSYYRHFGDTGLRHVARYYSSIPHRRVVKGMKERYKAGLYEITQSNYTGANKLLVLRPAEDFVPCRGD